MSKKKAEEIRELTTAIAGFHYHLKTGNCVHNHSIEYSNGWVYVDDSPIRGAGKLYRQIATDVHGMGYRAVVYHNTFCVPYDVLDYVKGELRCVQCTSLQ